MKPRYLIPVPELGFGPVRETQVGPVHSVPLPQGLPRHPATLTEEPAAAAAAAPLYLLPAPGTFTSPFPFAEKESPNVEASYNYCLPALIIARYHVIFALLDLHVVVGMDWLMFGYSW